MTTDPLDIPPGGHTRLLRAAYEALGEDEFRKELERKRLSEAEIKAIIAEVEAAPDQGIARPL